MRPLAAGSLLAAAIFGCHPIVGLEPPPISGRTQLLLTEPSSGAVRAEVVEGEVDRAFSERGDFELTLLDYECSTTRLGLELGPQTLEEEARTELLLPPPKALLLASVRDGTPSGWTSSETVEPETEAILRRLDLPEDNRCRLFASPLEELGPLATIPSAPELLFEVELNDGELLVGTRYEPEQGSQEEGYGELWLVDLNGTNQFTQLSTSSAVVSAFRDASGKVYAVDGLGQLLEAQGSELRVITSSISRPFEHARLVGSPDGDELYLFTDTGVLATWSGAGWEILFDLDPPESEPPALVWLGPGHVLAAPHGHGRALIEVSNGEVHQELISADVGRLTAVRNIDGIGVLFASFRGLFLRSDEGDYAPFEAPTAPELEIGGAEEIIASEFGFRLLTYTFGRVQFSQYTEDSGFCLDAPTVGAFPRGFLRMRDGRLVVTSLSLDGPAFRFFVLEEHAPEGCGSF